MWFVFFFPGFLFHKRNWVEFIGLKVKVIFYLFICKRTSLSGIWLFSEIIKIIFILLLIIFIIIKCGIECERQRSERPSVEYCAVLSLECCVNARVCAQLSLLLCVCVCFLALYINVSSVKWVLICSLFGSCENFRLCKCLLETLWFTDAVL